MEGRGDISANISIYLGIWEIAYLTWILPSSVQVGKFSASPIRNWDWSYNHCETHPTQDKYIASAQETEIWYAS